MKNLRYITALAALLGSTWVVAAEPPAAKLAPTPKSAHAVASKITPGKQVLAFYYPWYGTPQGPGGKSAGDKWIHWEGVDAAKQSIDSSTHYPTLGAYDSHDSTLISRHVAEAKQAGIDGFIVSWWGKGTFEDRALVPILDGCDKGGLSACIYYEQVAKPVTAASCAAEIRELLGRVGSHKAYMKVEGRPVVFIYGRAIGQLNPKNWTEVVALLAEGKGPMPILIADQVSDAAAATFDGTHTYNPAGNIEEALRKHEALEEWGTRAFDYWVNVPRNKGKIACVTVIPGYDDTKVRKPGLKVARKDLYESLWEHALRVKPDWVLITSFNEWHEGSEIEPSAELGEAAMKSTASFATRFHAGAPPQETPKPK